MCFKKAPAQCVANKAAKEKAANDTPATKPYAEAKGTCACVRFPLWPPACGFVFELPWCVRLSWWLLHLCFFYDEFVLRLLAVVWPPCWKS